MKTLGETMLEKEAVDATMIGVGHKATLTGVGTVGFGWLFTSEAAVLYGLIIGLLGIGIQLFFGFRKDRREHAEHKARMLAMQHGGELIPQVERRRAT